MTIEIHCWKFLGLQGSRILFWGVFIIVMSIFWGWHTLLENTHTGSSEMKVCIKFQDLRAQKCDNPGGHYSWGSIPILYEYLHWRLFLATRSPWPTSQTSTRLNPNNTMHFFVAPREFCDIFFRLLACNYFTTSICLTRVILLPTDQLSKKCTIIREILQTWPYRPYILALFDPRKRGQN